MAAVKRRLRLREYPIGEVGAARKILDRPDIQLRLGQIFGLLASQHSRVDHRADDHRCPLAGRLGILGRRKR